MTVLNARSLLVLAMGFILCLPEMAKAAPPPYTSPEMAKKLGHMPELVPSAVIVPGGVVRIMQLEKAGFAYIRP
jgi:hypothetical protein